MRSCRQISCGLSIAVALTACNHSAAHYPAPPTVGPISSTADLKLTFNPEQDYWPTWTADGQGILYSFGNAAPATAHRCIGLLPAAGGTRLWELCDNRGTEVDSLNSFTAYALAADGRLLYAEAETFNGAQSLNPAVMTLWLADTASPFQRRPLLTLPMPVAGVSMSWIAEIAWTGPTEFTALAQEFGGAIHCRGCTIFDSVFTGIGVIRGTIGASGATVALVAGTEGATSYSVAEGGASIAFTKSGDPHLFKVPATGGNPVSVAQVSAGGSLLGVSCVGTTCVVADDPLGQIGDGSFEWVGTAANPSKLHAVSLATGASQVVFTDPLAVIATPGISQAGHDVVAQRGGILGHLQTVSSPLSDLHLYRALLP